MSEPEDFPESPRNHPVRTFFLGLAIALLALLGGAITFFGVRTTATSISNDHRQQGLVPFYTPPPNWESSPPGTLLRSEPVGGVPSGGIGWRVLYVTQRADDTKAVSSGLVFAPGPHATAAPASGRDVVAWAHPTVGMGDSCAPSRTANVESDVQGLTNYLAAGWVVAATDYAGLGTKGTEQYLIGASEAHDVLNSVRAARQIPEANAGTRVGLWGHSQGGQSVLWAASDQSYAPELTIVGTVAAAPAAELPVLISHQWSTIYGSLIGAEVLVSYPSTYADLGTRAVSNRSGASIRALSDKCIVAAAVDIAASKAVGRSSLLTHNPLDVPAWRKTLEENTPPAPRVPTLIIQGLDDPIVLPGSNAAFLARSCAAGAPVDGAFIGKLGHMKAGAAGAPLAFTWLQQRFAGITMTSTCGTVLPIAPLVQPRP